MGENLRDVMSLDPFSVKKNLVDLLDKNLGIKNPNTYESGFLGYLVQSLTLITSDVLFNNAMAYNEAFTQHAILPSSIESLSEMFDYNKLNAVPCVGKLAVSIPFPIDTESYRITLKNGTTCVTQKEIPYKVYGTYNITVGMTPQVQRKDPFTGNITELPINVEIVNGNRVLIFFVDVWQVRVYEYDFQFENLQLQRFYDVNISGFRDRFYTVEVGVYTKENNSTYTHLIKFKRVKSLYSCGNDEKVFTFTLGTDGNAQIRFGNGIFGYQPEEGSSGYVVVYTTMGADGGIVANSIGLNESLIDIDTNKSVQCTATNIADIKNGQNEESIEKAKKHIIDQISSAKRLVTMNDYLNYEGIVGTRNTEVYPMLLRRDTNVNEIDLFSVFYDTDGKPIPTTCVDTYIDNDTKFIDKSKVYKIAIKKGDNGLYAYNDVENGPDVLTENRIDCYYYLDPEKTYTDPILEQNKGKIAIYKGATSGGYEFVVPDEIKEYVCPYNIIVEQTLKNRRALFEYIPNKLTLKPTLQNQIGEVNVEVSIDNTMIDVIPENSKTYHSIPITHINFVHTIKFSSGVDYTLLTGEIYLKQAGQQDKKYTCELRKADEANQIVIISAIVPINDLFENTFQMDTVLYYGSKFYNTYSKNITLMESGKINEDMIGATFSYIYDPNDPLSIKPRIPAIDKIEFGLTTMSVKWDEWEDPIDSTKKVKGYNVEVSIGKTKISNDEKLRCTLKLGVGEVPYDPYSKFVNQKGTLVTYNFRVPYDRDIIPDGDVNYRIDLDYKFTMEDGSPSPQFTPFSIYSGHVILKRIIKQLMWSNVELIHDNITNSDRNKIYRIPVIEKNYYNENKEALETIMLYMLAEIDTKFIGYKMLTDTCNLKFAQTYGVTRNLKYNDGIQKIDENLKYNGWIWDNPPTIKVKIYIKKNTARSKNDIINECREVLLCFLQLKSTFNAKIVRSEAARYIHEVIPEIVSCEIIEPTKDILYLYNESHLPKNKNELLGYVPEFVWIDIDKIKVDAIILP